MHGQPNLEICVFVGVKVRIPSTDFRKNNEISNFLKIRPVAAQLFYADGQTDRHDEANSRFSQFCIQD
jgi:hypothetical protein